MGKPLNKKGWLNIQVPISFIMGRSVRTVEGCLEIKKGYSFKLEDSEAGVIYIEAAGKLIALGRPVRQEGIMCVEVTQVL